MTHFEQIPIFTQLNISGDLSLTDLCVFGCVWLFSEMSGGICDAKQETIGDELFVSWRTVARSLRALVSAGLLDDETPDLRNKPHKYRPTLAAMEIIATGRPPKEEQLPQPPVVTTQNGGQADDLPASPANGSLKDFGDLYSAWSKNFGELKPRQIEMLGDYFDENNEWTLRAFDEAVTQEPDRPWPYFKRIIDGWVKNGGPTDKKVQKRNAATAPHLQQSTSDLLPDMEFSL